VSPRKAVFYGRESSGAGSPVVAAAGGAARRIIVREISGFGDLLTVVSLRFVLAGVARPRWSTDLAYATAVP
jgi:hypothetical protein